MPFPLYAAPLYAAPLYAAPLMPFPLYAAPLYKSRLYSRMGFHGRSPVQISSNPLIFPVPGKI